MFWFVTGLIVLVIGMLLAVTGAVLKPKVMGLIAAGVVCVLLGGLAVVLSTVREVPTKSVGVVTSFGRVGAIVTPGLHFMAPWKTVNILTTRVQTTTFEGKNCLSVRIGGQQEACLDATIQWHVLDPAAPGLFSNYGAPGEDPMQDIKNAVVVREFKQAVNQQLGDYNPIQDVSVNGTAGNSQFTTFGPLVLKQMRTEIGGRVAVQSVIMPFLHYDRATQGRLNTIQTQFAETAIARQLDKTNLALSKANGDLIKSLNPNVLTNLCLTITQNAEKTGYQGLPVGWNCFGSTNSLALTGK